jgi:predicted transglutaminase-like cysteine proteinase
VALIISSAAFAAGIDTKSAMKVLGTARAPIGYAMFCSSQPGECRAKGAKNAREVLDAARFAELDRINREINVRIAPVTDAELYGTAERWVYPVDKGDCEDYVLLKRRTLIEAGWDPSSLLITVVRDQKGDGHAVLTVATDRGDFVLDNQNDAVLSWQATGYEFIKRQSQSDPQAWVFVGPDRPENGVASTRR